MEEKDRYSEWLNNSLGLMRVEVLLVGNAQGLGLLDIELIQEFSKINLYSQLEDDKLKKLKHITLSELWVMGAYELIRMIDKKLSKRNDLDDEMAKKIKDTIKLFTEIRIPLTKFQREGKNELYSGVTVPTYDSIKGAGWKIHFTNKDKVETKIIYRKNLADNLLELLKSINK